MPPISATAPDAVSTAARIAPVPGQAPPGIGRVGSRLVREQRRPALQRQGRGQQLLVVEAAVAGDEDRLGASRAASPSSSSRPAAATVVLERRGADHEGASPRARPLGRERGGRHPGGDDPLLGGRHPGLAQPLGVGRPAGARGCW